MEPSGDDDLWVQLGNGVLRAGEDERTPERLSTGTLLGGRAIRASLAGSDYYRTLAR